jgi:hypothetical protein
MTTRIGGDPPQSYARPNGFSYSLRANAETIPIAAVQLIKNSSTVAPAATKNPTVKHAMQMQPKSHVMIAAAEPPRKHAPAAIANLSLVMPLVTKKAMSR